MEILLESEQFGWSYDQPTG